MNPTLVLLSLLLPAPSMPAPSLPPPATPAPFEEAALLEPIFAGYRSCFVLLDGSSGMIRILGEGCRERSTPASTFKVPHALIALETGVVSGADFRLPWDGERRKIASWNRDHDLRSAIADSALWYFQETARRIGSEAMEAGLASLRFGNADSSSGLTTFWLGGSLEVSPLEQVDFLERLRTGRLPVSARSSAIVSELIIVGESGGAVLRGKSGTALDPDVGWFVGWLERDERAWVFATRIEGEGARGFSTARRMSERALALLCGWATEY